jgi:methyltransferase
MIQEARNVRKNRRYTVSVAIPGSIVKNAQSAELRTYLVGQIARACAIFEIDEVIVFSEDGRAFPGGEVGYFEGPRGNNWDPNLFLVRVLAYLECPQYLRKNFFPIHKDLQFAGLLNPLDTPHHMGIDDWSLWREGVVLRHSGSKSVCAAGTRREAECDQRLQVGMRVTLKMADRPGEITSSGRLPAKVVPPTQPTHKAGLYWGYSTRLASGISGVFRDCPWAEGYDLRLGCDAQGEDATGPRFELPPFQHALLVVGGIGGLEVAMEGDENLPAAASTGGKDIFDRRIRTCEGQGSRTVRTEEALLIALSALRLPLETSGKHAD